MSMIRSSKRGNPYHYPKGHPRGGQFAPKGYAQAAAAVNGVYFENRSDFEAYSRSSSYDSDSARFYGEKTAQRFNREPSDEQKKLAEKIAKKTGTEPPSGGTYREYDEYINSNVHEYVSASENQARTIRHLEESQGVKLAYDDRYGGSAGSYIGHIAKAETLQDKNNWEKGEDGCYYCVTHKPKKNGEPGTQNQGYRIRPVKDGNKTRYVVERGVSSWEKGPDGKKVRHMDYHSIESDKTGLKSLVKDDLDAARKRAALNETRRYQKHVTTNKGRKRKPEGMVKSVEAMESMGSKDNWTESNGKFSFDTTYDENNSYGYHVEMGSTGYHAYRMVTNVQTMTKYDKRTGTMRTVKIPHTRQEWVATGCSTPEEAMSACQKHEASTIVAQRINPKAATDGEIEKWKKQERIRSKNEYNHLLDRAKAILK